jgi:cell fate (sporulation/competence/biofilm development) regulator YlbF (YheA/YmcA/DUF963 family)
VRTISIENLATDLAKAIKETEEFTNLNAAQARVQLDPKAHQLITDMEQSHQAIQQAQSTGQPVQTEIQKLQLLQQQSMQNPTLKQLFEAQQAFGKIMEDVNQIINQELSS